MSAPSSTESAQRHDFRALYDQYVPHVWRWAAHLGVPPGALEDVVQEVFFTLYSRLSDFDERRSSLKTWVFGVAFHVVRNFRRRRANRPAGETSELSTFASNAPHPEAVATHAEAMMVLQNILDRLDEEKREVFILAELEQLSGAEIGALLGISVNTVTSRLKRARDAVRAAWEREQARDAWRLR